MKARATHSDTLENFVNLFNANHVFEDCKGNQRSFERDEVADENSLLKNKQSPENLGRATPSLLTDLYRMATRRMTYKANKNEKACVAAMIDTVCETHGLFVGSYKSVAADYLPIFGELNEVDLNRARVFLMHQGPVLGLACRNVQEFKWVVARHFTVGDFVRDHAVHSHQMAACFALLQKGDKANLNSFSELCGEIYREEKAARRLGASKVKTFLKCDGETAGLMAKVYEALPDMPLA